MASAPAITRALPISKRHPVAARILSSWRALTGGPAVRDADRPTLVACSGGADSTALLLALAAARGAAAVAHIVHDLRPRTASLADRDAVKALARRLGIPFLEATGATRTHRGNPEAVARTLRYGALTKLARGAKLRFIATAHHADDQLETILMRLTRGAGPAGLAGIAPTRRLAPNVTVIRPCLAVTRADLESLCTSAGVEWSTDATNADATRLRSAIRHTILPLLRKIAPHTAARTAESAGLLRELHEASAARARALLRAASTELPNSLRRGPFARGHPAIASLALRLAISKHRDGAGLDRLPRRTLAAISRALRDGVGGTREFAAAGLIIRLAGEVMTFGTPAAARGVRAKKASGGGRQRALVSERHAAARRRDD